MNEEKNVGQILEEPKKKNQKKNHKNSDDLFILNSGKIPYFAFLPLVEFLFIFFAVLSLTSFNAYPKHHDVEKYNTIHMHVQIENQ